MNEGSYETKLRMICEVRMNKKIDDRKYDRVEKNENDVVSEAEAYYKRSQDKSLSNPEQIEFLTKAIELDGNNLKYMLTRAITYKDSSNFAKALDDFASILHTEEESWVRELAHAQRVTIFKDNLKDYKNAVVELTNAIELEPNKERGYTHRAEFYRDFEKNYNKALTDYDRAIELSPDAADLYYTRGKLYEENLNDKVNAFKDYCKAIVIDSEWASTCIDFMYENSELISIIDKEQAYIFCKQVQKAINYYDADLTYKLLPFLQFQIEYHETKNEFKEAIDILTCIEDGYHFGEDSGYFIDWTCELQDKLREQEVEKAKLEEKDRIMFNLSHTIKNILGTIIDPLKNMKADKEYEEVTIDDALRGTQIIRGIVNAMSLGFSGSIDDFKYDVKNSNESSKSLYDLILDSFKYSVGAMFDDKYFGKFSENYFETDEALFKAEGEWNHTSNTNNLNRLVDFVNKHMFDIEINIDSAKELVLGDDKGSALRMLIMFQEIILNAVKYASPVKRDNRKVFISLIRTDKSVVFEVKNSFKAKSRMKTTGLGKEIVKNFAKLLETEPCIKMDDYYYSVKIEFNNFWRKK